MTLKSTILGAAAAAALMLAAAPGFAQTSSSPSPSSPPPYSSSSPSSQGAPSGTDTMQQNQQYPSGTPSGTSGTAGSASSSATNTASTVPLSQVQNPSTALASAQVQDSAGQNVGQVQKVETGASGKVSKVDVTLSTSTASGKTVAIPAHDLRFDQSGNILKARLTQSEIEKLQSSSSTNPM